jgi:hypothetical protein
MTEFVDGNAQDERDQIQDRVLELVCADVQSLSPDRSV